MARDFSFNYFFFSFIDVGSIRIIILKSTPYCDELNASFFFIFFKQFKKKKLFEVFFNHFKMVRIKWLLEYF